MEERQPSGWAIGFTMFAAIMLMIAGSFQIIAGLTGIFENEVYAATQTTRPTESGTVVPGNTTASRTGSTGRALGISMDSLPIATRWVD